MIQDVNEFCRLFYYTTRIPTAYFNLSTDEINSYMDELLTKHPIRNIPNGIDRLTRNPDYVITDSFGYVGYVESLDHKHGIIIGPVFSTSCSEETLRLFMKEWYIQPDYIQDIRHFFSCLPLVTFNQFLHNLSYLYFCLNDISINIFEHFNLHGLEHTDDISANYVKNTYQAYENQKTHSTYLFEQQLFELVQKGNVKELKKVLDNVNGLSEGSMADNSLRQSKNRFITTITLATRAAIAGGLQDEAAYQLSDTYIQECESSQNIEYIVQLEYNMLLDLTERVSRSIMPQGMSMDIFKSVQFITRHTNEPIQVDDVAAYIGKSRSHLSAKFKKELGFDISSFIMRCKLEEAKSLLTYSDMSLSEISNYLWFSSQSYFQNVFKKKYGMTPKQYRDKSSK